ncbi:hypothetical protein FT663_03634 [Candidozyma haemuli var. vulneris]|uniref:Major facilitator superfamily (MFS) profile domain-containing protein n=1 Tax=Candidozyma haemuli TaxID=45357 RepID=A0A2V1AXG5_9ASCO|nr:hypothetical protein CXQ85_005028 [[Candida] haemuloni]KAF3985096.1 hypothetical protein FT662_05356 [[Candida] haemuloni var. vulneris]KAF3989437.1 hypothetical protein FT663_03634 [[Candida] haemuloni var. vulneris]PVH22459.1 hypothetical protein CXQ85_005028 [[Candida] haemuloni]
MSQTNLEQTHSGAPTNITNPNDNILLDKEIDKDVTIDPPKEVNTRSGKEYIAMSIFCFLVAFGGFVFGFDTGTISGFVAMDDFKERFGQLNGSGEYYLSNSRTGLMVSIFNVGCCIGGIFIGRIGDMWGRRIGIMVAMAIYVVGIAIQISSDDKWYQFFIGRMVTGLAVGTVSVVAPVFISEVAPKQVRGTLVCCYQLCITLGIFIGYCCTYGTKTYDDAKCWRIPLGLCFVWAALLVAGMVNMPESPRFLMSKQRVDDARRSIARSNKVDINDDVVEAEIRTIQAGLDKEALAGNADWMELINGKPKILRRVLVGVMTAILQQLSGINYFFYYGTTIFKAVGMDDSFKTSIILGAVNFVSTFANIWAIESLGRRKTLLIGSVCMTICLIIYSALGSAHLYIDGFDNTPENTRKPTGNAMIFITCLNIFFFASTWAGGVYCILSETYPLRIRSKAMSVATGANWMFGFLIAFFTPFITSAIHFNYGFVFAGSMLFSVFFIYFFLCETKGLSLEEVDEMYASGLKAWKTSDFVPQAEKNEEV